MTSKETIKQILKDEYFIKQLQNILDKKLNSKRVYDLVNNINYPLEDFKAIRYLNSQDGRPMTDSFLLKEFKKNDKYEIVEKSYENRCIILADNGKLEYHCLFVCEYIGDEDF